MDFNSVADLLCNLQVGEVGPIVDGTWESKMAGFGRFWPVFLRIPKTKTRSSSRAHPSVPATLCGERYSNAGLLGCFFPEDSQDRNLVFVDPLSRSRMGGHFIRYS